MMLQVVVILKPVKLYWIKLHTDKNPADNKESSTQLHAQISAGDHGPISEQPFSIKNLYFLSKL